MAITTIHDILEEFREAASSNRELGDKFERLIANYLVTDPLYKDMYSEVWLWGEWPDRGKQPDTGIDLVAKDRYTGEYCAIQCKFYDPAHSLQKADIDSFFTASGKSFPTSEGKKSYTSRIIVSTTDNWSKHAEEALNNQQIPVLRIRVQDLENSPVDWSQFSLKRPDLMKLRAKKQLRPHQKTARDHVLAGLTDADRGKLIMACGTGKTYTALKIAEHFAAGKTHSGHILFLVPSIALLSQSLLEWAAESELPMHCFAVCSDTAVGKSSDTEDIRLHDLPFPATTNARKLATQVQAFSGKKPLTVIFSTYQSIQTIADAQKHGAPAFDLIICDEAHRTTGVTLEGDDESYFVKVHDPKFIKASKRLYMTATPRIFSDGSKSKAEDADATICSMDDETLYGKELHRLGFGEAVGSGLLADYKVMVLAVDEKFVSKTFQKQLAVEGELNLDDVVKITGCWNGLSKRMAKQVDGSDMENDPAPMRRAVAFSRSIKDSKRLTELFAGIVEKYTEQAPEEESLLSCAVDHVDGTMNALKRSNKLDWLKADTSNEGNVCRILSNARCLSEGVDVPALDAVMFLNPRNSVVDVVQSVGRVMRIAPGKKYGYIILPIGIPADVPPEEALKDNQKYKVVWQVLQALRAHDDRFNATVNKIELNKKTPDNVQVIGVGGFDEGEDGQTPTGQGTPVQIKFDFPNLDEWRDAIFAKIVLKCGDRRYWESWAKDVAQIAERHITRIKALLEGANNAHRKAFDDFLKGLRTNLNPAVSEDDAIEMLAQHLITKPVFDALFEGYEFTRHNPVSQSMQAMLDLLETQALEREQQPLEKFYASVRQRAEGIDNAQGKQKVIVELYDKFFRTAFPRMAERLGIVYTPVEVVDFIIASADHALRQEFGVGLSDHGVHVLDPFTGTGTFMVRLLQSGLIHLDDLAHKYRHELHVNEIVLLAYYIAAINIEETYHSLALMQDPASGYQPFEGIVLTDTFQLNEGQGKIDDQFPENNKRAARQSGIDIRVIVGNPPYSAKQDSQNDNNQNLEYPSLDMRIANTYVVQSEAGLVNSLYDSYIRAFRWASDRIKDKGIICYVTNGGFIDGNAAAGVRKCLVEEFSSIYIFNLRGNARTSGEQRRMEKGNVFGEGTRTPVAITLLVKNPARQGAGELFYHDIGDYLSREEKLQIVSDFGSIESIPWRSVTPNEHGDWINARDPAFAKFMALGGKDDDVPLRIFDVYSNGVKTNRDNWVYNFSYSRLTGNMQHTIDFYNLQCAVYAKTAKRATGKPLAVEEVIDTNPKNISWTRGLKNDVRKQKSYEFDGSCIIESLYRPFTKHRLYFNRDFIEEMSKVPKLFPNEAANNLVISVTGTGANKPFCALIANVPIEYAALANGQAFPLYYYEESPQDDLLGKAGAETYIRRDAITSTALDAFRKTYADGSISKEDMFYYVYGVLHSPEYKMRFEADLKKMLPRIPYAKDFWAFSQAGRELAQWHLNYEKVEPYPLQQSSEHLDLGDKELYQVRKMTFGKTGKKEDKSTIIYNSKIRLGGIPPETYEYIVNGKPALEWVMERYQVTTDKDSGIKNDPNDWAAEHDDPQYILNLVKRIVRVSVETVRIVKSLPALDEQK